MDIDWVQIISSAVVTLLSVGGISWIFTIKEDKRTKSLENEKTKAEIDEFKKDEIIKDWKEIAEERKVRVTELEEKLRWHEANSAEKDKQITDLHERLDAKNTRCAVAELMRCDTISCGQRNPPWGMKEIKMKDQFK